MNFISKLGFLVAFVASGLAGLIIVWPSGDKPSPGDQYEHRDSGDTITIDQVGSEAELKIHYANRRVRIEDPQADADPLFGDVTQLPNTNIDPTAPFISYLLISETEGGVAPDTIAVLESVSDLHEAYWRLETENT